MPGMPKLNALASSIEEAGGDAVIFDQVANGVYMTKVAQEWGVSSQLLRKWVRLTPERIQAYSAAKHASADALVEQAGDHLDKASTISSQHIAKAKAQSGFKTWLAGKRDREQYGEEAALVNVNLSLPSIHLDLLRKRGRVIEIPEDVELLDEHAAASSDGPRPSVLSPPSDGEGAAQAQDTE